MINAARLGQMRPGAFIINTARGPLIDEAALVDALRSGHLAGAALDVFEEEPLPTASPLRELEQAILGSHNASNTREAVARANETVFEMSSGSMLRRYGADAARNLDAARHRCAVPTASRPAVRRAPVYEPPLYVERYASIDLKHGGRRPLEAFIKEPRIDAVVNNAGLRS
jgi:hypothetical protein